MYPLAQPLYPDELAPSLSPPAYLFDQRPPDRRLRVSVVVPVRNEADHLEQTLDALRHQQDHRGLPVPYESYEVLVLANNCTDLSYELAKRYQSRFPAFALHVASIRLAPDKANIGHVRRLLMDEACRRLLLAGNTLGIIASTDGDTLVDRYWISETITEIDKGNDAVGGRILTRTSRVVVTDKPERTGEVAGTERIRWYHLLDVTYRHLIARLEDRLDPRPYDPWPRHFQHFGASLAVTCAAYLKAGRLPEVPYLEDEAFYRALLRIDATVRKSPLVRVFTSTRTQGRVAVGFSWQLSQWAALPETRQVLMVEGLETIMRRFEIRRSLRNCWQMTTADSRTELLGIARELHLDPDWLCRELAASRYFGQLYEQVEQQIAGDLHRTDRPQVPIRTAIRDLRAYLYKAEQ